MQTLQDWFATPLGAYLLQQEQAYFDEAVADVFGFNAMQLGLPGVDLLRMNRIPLRFTAGADQGARLRTAFDHLPIESNSIDLVVLPHVLEFSVRPHQILREVQRVLLPEGQLIASVGTLKLVGTTEVAARGLLQLTQGNPVALFIGITWATGILTSIMDNVLAVATFIPVIADLAAMNVNVAPLWWGMLFGGTVMGNMTIIGSTANIVAIGILERRGLGSIGMINGLNQDSSYLYLPCSLLQYFCGGSFSDLNDSII